jgi:hypothetical protein
MLSPQPLSAESSNGALNGFPGGAEKVVENSADGGETLRVSVLSKRRCYSLPELYCQSAGIASDQESSGSSSSLNTLIGAAYDEEQDCENIKVDIDDSILLQDGTAASKQFWSFIAKDSGAVEDLNPVTAAAPIIGTSYAAIQQSELEIIKRNMDNALSDLLKQSSAIPDNNNNNNNRNEDSKQIHSKSFPNLTANCTC